MNATCPQCNHRLAQVDSPAGPVLGCETCDHRWLDIDGLESLQSTTTRNYTPEDVEALHTESKSRKEAALERPVVYMTCPACDNQMLRRTFGEVSFLLIHYCANHGYWIHGDELDAIVDYIKRGGEILEYRAEQEKLKLRLGDLERETRDLEQQKNSAGISFIPFT